MNRIAKVTAALSLLVLSGCITVTESPLHDIKSDPIDMAESRIALGLGYLEQGDRVRARLNLQRAMQHAPHYYRSQLSMAHYFETVGEDPSARQLYQTALREHPLNGNVLNNYGTFLCKQGEYRQAEQLFLRAIEQPYYYLIAASYENAGLCALKSGETETAQHYLQRALDHDPNRSRSLLQLAKIEMDNQEFASAQMRLTQFKQRYGEQKAGMELQIELEKRMQQFQQPQGES